MLADTVIRCRRDLDLVGFGPESLATREFNRIRLETALRSAPPWSTTQGQSRWCGSRVRLDSVPRCRHRDRSRGTCSTVPGPMSNEPAAGDDLGGLRNDAGPCHRWQYGRSATPKKGRRPAPPPLILARLSSHSARFTLYPIASCGGRPRLQLEAEVQIVLRAVLVEGARLIVDSRRST